MRHILNIRSRNLAPQSYQIYYLFAFSTVGRPLIPFLRKLGLNCTEPKENPAQGTVSTVLFFENIYLELFWFDDNSHLAQSELTEELNLLARLNWLETGASPFGFGLCSRKDPANLSNSQSESRQTHKTKIAEQNFQFVPNNSDNPDEPIVYVVPNYVANGSKLNRVWSIDEPILTHSLGMRELTRVQVQVIGERIVTNSLLSLVAQNILDIILDIEYKKHPLLELTFDDGNRQKCLDLRPLLPMVLRY